MKTLAFFVLGGFESHLGGTMRDLLEVGLVLELCCLLEDEADVFFQENSGEGAN